MELTHDVLKIVQVYSDSLPEMELQGALVGGIPSPSRPHQHGQPALQHPGVHHGGRWRASITLYAPILLKCALWVRVALFCGTVGEGEVCWASMSDEDICE